MIKQYVVIQSEGFEDDMWIEESTMAPAPGEVVSCEGSKWIVIRREWQFEHNRVICVVIVKPEAGRR